MTHIKRINEMIHKYTSYGKTKIYKIPNIPQIGDYRYAKDLTCSCSISDSFDKQLKKWHCDGVYDSHIGILICFTCKECGEKFCYHIRNNWDDYAELGVFDEYLVN